MYEMAAGMYEFNESLPPSTYSGAPRLYQEPFVL